MILFQQMTFCSFAFWKREIVSLLKMRLKGLKTVWERGRFWRRKCWGEKVSSIESHIGLLGYFFFFSCLSLWESHAGDCSANDIHYDHFWMLQNLSLCFCYLHIMWQIILRFNFFFSFKNMPQKSATLIGANCLDLIIWTGFFWSGVCVAVAEFAREPHVFIMSRLMTLFWNFRAREKERERGEITVWYADLRTLNEHLHTKMIASVWGP